MFYCSNPTCSNPFNPDGNKFCQSCGSQALSPLFRNRFRVIQLLGQGGFGRTYEAIDADRMDDPCVIKQFFAQVQGTAALEKAKELFKQEAKRLYDLGEHPQIPRLVAYFEQDKRLYHVQELIEGQNLLSELIQQGAFSEEKIRQLLVDLLPVLQVVHDRKVIHRDIKPENIMRRRSDRKLMLIDFGVSKEATGTIVGQVGTTVGTPGYAPIEQMRGQVYPASDLYSLGVTCIRLLTQCLPQESGYDELYDALNGCWKWRDRLPDNTTISRELGQILDKLLQDYVKDRYQSVDEVLQDFNLAFTQPDTSITSKTSVSVTSSQQIYVSSSVGVDYTKLRDLLSAQQWVYADEETKNVILKACRQTEKWLTIEDIESLPAQDIEIINKLWINYSNGHFGFSVQKRIWQTVGGKVGLCDSKIYENFADKVKWRVRNNWLYWSDLTFSLKAPQGHLPGRIAGKIESGGIRLTYDYIVPLIALKLI